ncbi:MAG: c-type cytochrome [Syntrophomonadaceae bacterium]
MDLLEGPAPSRRARLGYFVLVLGVGAAVVAAAGGQGERPGAPAAAAGASIERGRYLTHEVAMCVQCHSPRDESGRIIESQEFRGAPMPLRSPYPGVDFALRAPDLRGLAHYSEEAVVRLLETGIARDGNRPQLPMPPFRMNHEDAQSIAMYLHSLQ